jgi:hypothetical protein
MPVRTNLKLARARLRIRLCCTCKNISERLVVRWLGPVVTYGHSHQYKPQGVGLDTVCDAFSAGGGGALQKCRSVCLQPVMGVTSFDQTCPSGYNI